MEARTLGQFVADEGILESLRTMIADINARATSEAKKVGKQEKLPVVQCFKCDAKKACCHSVVVARLYEGIVVAAHLKQASRDTPALRDELRTRAEAMEAASPYEWRVPCLFLDDNERCTVYAARPTPCGTLYVYTPPAHCNDPSKPVHAYIPDAEHAVAQQIEDEFRDKLSLRKKVGRRYIGVLPRMVLVALEAWDRTDFRDYLRQLEWPTDTEADRWRPRAP
ncbi:MAG TPA: YkgJ family cysteine cluster protein [Kofleriaceae bacterium]|nr:YkgJ family cysteine cluster protein [Kofleriaceae bacterium]